MTTKVGLQSDLTAAVKDLIELDFDAIEAYKAAIDRLEGETYKKTLEEFKKDHMRHTHELSTYLKERGESPPVGPSAKSILTKGKVILATLLGEKQILSAMLTNEDDTNKAYERMNEYPEAPQELKDILKRGLQDERRHREYIKSELEALS
jgi:rubrerythrin